MLILLMGIEKDSGDLFFFSDGNIHNSLSFCFQKYYISQVGNALCYVNYMDEGVCQKRSVKIVYFAIKFITIGPLTELKKTIFSS